VRRVLKKMGPAVFAVSAAQISLMINTSIASRLAEGSISWLSYADRLMEFPTALLGVALGTILLPSLSKARRWRPQEYSALLDWGLRLTFLLALPAAVGWLPGRAADRHPVPLWRLHAEAAANRPGR
jgi:putative peptidoglycan lipid II flippase